MGEINYKLVGLILGSSYRRKVLTSLSKISRTPKNISENTNISINHVSNILKELSNKDLIKCKTPKLKKGRLYSITEKGEEIVKLIEKMKT